jgi:hypothetical protein
VEEGHLHQLELLEQLEPLVLLDQLAQQVLMHLRLQQL